MSLIDEVEKLRELEQATREDTEISSPIDDSDYLERLVDAAPDMLAVLSVIQAGDAKKIQDFGMRLHAQCAQVFPDDWALLNRFQRIAVMMEKEGM